MNDMWWCELYPPHRINVATLLAESRNTINARKHNFSFKRQLKSSCYMHHITLRVTLNVLMNHINEHSFHGICSKCPPSSCTHDLRWSHHWSIAASIIVLVKVKPSLHGVFSQVFDVMILSFIHALLYNTPNKKFKAHDDPGPLWWSYDTSDAIFFGILPL